MKIYLVAIILASSMYGCGLGDHDDAREDKDNANRANIDDASMPTMVLPSLRPEGFLNSEGSSDEYLSFVNPDRPKDSLAILPVDQRVRDRRMFIEKFNKRVLLGVQHLSGDGLSERLQRLDKLSGDKDCRILISEVSKSSIAHNDPDIAGSDTVDKVSGGQKKVCVNIPVSDQNSADSIWDCTLTESSNKSPNSKLNAEAKTRTTGLISGSAWEAKHDLEGRTELIESDRTKISKARQNLAFFDDLERNYYASAGLDFAVASQMGRGDSPQYMYEKMEARKVTAGEKFSISYTKKEKSKTNDLRVDRALSVSAEEISEDRIDFHVKYRSENQGNTPIDRDEKYSVVRNDGAQACAVTLMAD